MLSIGCGLLTVDDSNFQSNLHGEKALALYQKRSRDTFSYLI